jgi:tellurite resistance protein TehA-like permease
LPRRTAALWGDREIRPLYPGYFALVMATGIVSNALYSTGRHALSDLLLAVAATAFPWLAALTLARAFRHPRAIWSDLVDPQRVFAFFTIVAASDVLGLGLHLRGHEAFAFGLWLFATAAWLLLIYFSFGVLIFLNAARGANVVHGGWLIAIVGTESVAVLGAAIAPLAGSLAASVFVLSHMFWGVGLGLYAIFITLFAYRIFFFEFGPEDITPLLWVVMGAAAICTNAGSTLIMADSGMDFLAAMRPFVDGVTLLTWAWATWWIPLLVVFGIWKHGVCRQPIVYTPMLWSLVFPLGMYSLASLKLSLAADFPPLAKVAQAMVWIAVFAWAATFAGMLAALWRGFRDFRRAAG